MKRAIVPVVVLLTAGMVAYVFAGREDSPSHIRPEAQVNRVPYGLQAQRVELGVESDIRPLLPSYQEQDRPTRSPHRGETEIGEGDNPFGARKEQLKAEREILKNVLGSYKPDRPPQDKLDRYAELNEILHMYGAAWWNELKVDETESNDACVDADFFDESEAMEATIDPETDVDYFYVDVGPGIYTFETSARNYPNDVYDTRMWLENDDCSVEYDYDDDGGDGYYSMITYTLAARTTLKVRIESYAQNYTGDYYLTVTAVAGCNPVDVEPDDNSCTTTPHTLSCDIDEIELNLLDENDFDWIELTLTETKKISLWTGPCGGSNADTRIELFEDDCVTSLAYNDDGGPSGGYFSGIGYPCAANGIILPAGTYYIAIDPYPWSPGSSYFDDYTLYLECCDAPAWPPAVVAELFCDYDSTDQYISVPYEQDFYLFNGTAGQVVQFYLAPSAMGYLDTGMELFDDVGMSMGYNDDGGPWGSYPYYMSGIGPVTLPYTGAYYVMAEASPTWCPGCVGPYAMVMYCVPPYECPPPDKPGWLADVDYDPPMWRDITCNDTLCGYIDAPLGGDWDLFVFTTDEWNCMTFDVYANATPGWPPYTFGLDPYLYFGYTDGYSIWYYYAIDDNFGPPGPWGYDTRIKTPCWPPSTLYSPFGTWALALRDNWGTMGPYVLATECLPCEPTPDCVFIEECNGDLNTPGGTVFWADGEYVACDRLYWINVGGDDHLHVIDQYTCTSIADCELPYYDDYGVPVSMRGVAYDQNDQTVWVGRWNWSYGLYPDILQHTTDVGDGCNLLGEFFYGTDMPVSGLAMDNENRHLWVMTNSAPDQLFEFDVSSGTPVLLQGPITVPWYEECPGLAEDYSGAGLEYNEYSDMLMAINQSGGTAECFIDNDPGYDGTGPEPGVTLSSACYLAYTGFPWGLGVVDGDGMTESGELYTVDIVNNAYYGPFPVHKYEPPCDFPGPERKITITFGPTSPQTIHEGTCLDVTVTAECPCPNHIITLTDGGLPSWATWSTPPTAGPLMVTGVVSFCPPCTDDPGPHVITFNANDTGGHVASEDFTCNIELNQLPYWTDAPDADLYVEELRTVTMDIAAADDDGADVLDLFCTDQSKYNFTFTYTAGNPATGDFTFNSDDCDDYENGPDYTFEFMALDNHLPACPESIYATTVVHVLNNDPPVIVDVTGEPECFLEQNEHCFMVDVDDPDDYPEDMEGSLGEVAITYEFLWDVDAPLPTDYTFTFVDNGDQTAELCFTPGADFVPAVDMAFPDYHGLYYQFEIEFTATDKCGETDTWVEPVTVGRDFLLHVKKIHAYAGEQHVKVPVFLWNYHEIGGYDIVIEFDPSAELVGVELCDGAWAEHPDTDEIIWHPAPDPMYTPEYFTYNLGVYGHANYVRVVGIQNLPWPQPVVPDLPPGCQQLLFCLIFDVSPQWDGHNIVVGFHTKQCPDNTLTDSEGYQVWGPDEESAPEWTCPDRPDEFRLVTLISRHAIGLRTTIVGDLNCNDIPYEIGDAVVFINYLVFGESELCGGECAAIPDCETYQTDASDINGDGYFWTVADLVMLLNIINGYDYPASKASLEPVEVDVTETDGGWAVKTTSNASLGAALFTFECPEGASVVASERLEDMTVTSSMVNGEMKVLVYSMESDAIDAGSGTLFTITEKATRSDARGKLTLVDASFSDTYGRLLPTGEVGKYGVQSGADADAPRVFTLGQSYPNPFATRTTISYGIPKASDVTLKVYNLTGQLVETLVDGNVNAGFHKATWDASDVPSGLYFYRIAVRPVGEANEDTATRRVVILR